MKFQKQILCLFGLILATSGCSTAKKSSEGTSRTRQTGAPSASTKSGKSAGVTGKSSGELPAVIPAETPIEPIDYDALKRTVGLARSKEQLGYIEKLFDGCGPQFGLTAASCQRHYLVSIQYRLLCRDSEGTVSEAITADQLQPITNQDLSWNLKGLQGATQTDHAGYGEVLTVSKLSQRDQRLKISNGDDFLYLRAGEVERLVTPAPWCRTR